MMHLGPRVAALVDGQLGPAEEERAWAHVHVCPTCQAAVEREGWVKRQLAALAWSGQDAAPSRLKGSLANPSAGAGQLRADPAWASWELPRHSRTRRLGGLVALGAGSAMMGVLALGAAPAGGPAEDRRIPVNSLLSTSRSPTPSPARDRDVTRAVRTVVTALRLGR